MARKIKRPFFTALQDLMETYTIIDWAFYVKQKDGTKYATWGVEDQKDRSQVNDLYAEVSRLKHKIINPVKISNK